MADRACPQCKKHGRDRTDNHLFLLKNGNGWYCNRCGYFEPTDSVDSEEHEVAVPPEPDERGLALLSEAQVLPFRKEYRGIPAFVAELFEVRAECSTETGDVKVSYYPAKKNGKLIGFKTRTHPKKFWSFPKGALKGDVDLFGRGTASNTVVITGGEEDAMAAYYMLMPTNKSDNFELCVYSIVHGEMAVQDIVNNLKFLNTFNKIILCLDNDGKTKEKEIAAVIGAKAFIMSFSEKDANAMLLAGKSKEFISAFWKAERYKPQEIVFAEEIIESVFVEEDESPVRYPFQELNKMLGGIRKKELVTLCAGTGVGKTTFVHHIISNVLKSSEWKIGTMCLEEAPRRTLKNLARVAETHTSHALSELVENRMVMMDCWGSNSIETIEEVVRYFSGIGMDMIILDHVSMMVADIEDDERRTLDKIMVRLRTLVQELDVFLLVVAHLRRAQGDVGYEDGKQVSLSALRSSASIGQLSDVVIALERKVSDDNEEVKNEVKLRVLKNRYSGITGSAGKLRYEGKKLIEML